MRNIIRPRNRPPYPIISPRARVGACDAMQPNQPPAFRFTIPRARGTTRPRVIAFISRTMKPICDAVYSPCPSCSASPSLSLPLSVFLSLFVSSDIATGDLRSSHRRHVVFVFHCSRRERCIGTTILSHAASFERFDLRGCAYI